MEQKSPDNLQMRFEDKPESIRVGDKLKYVKEEGGGYFINSFGFRIDTLPVSTKIKTAGFGITFGLDMPESEGLIMFKDGQTFFKHEEKFLDKVNYQEYKFFDGDIIEIVALPS